MVAGWSDAVNPAHGSRAGAGGRALAGGRPEGDNGVVGIESSVGTGLDWQVPGDPTARRIPGPVGMARLLLIGRVVRGPSQRAGQPSSPDYAHASGADRLHPERSRNQEREFSPAGTAR
jgi:hypothetical protein